MFYGSLILGFAVQNVSELPRLRAAEIRGLTRPGELLRKTLGRVKYPLRPKLAVRRLILHGARGDHQVKEDPPRGARRNGTVREHLRRSHHHHRSRTEREAVAKVAGDHLCRKPGLVAQGGQEAIRAD